MTYVIETGDTLTAIAVRFGLAPAGTSSSLQSWAPALAAAQRLADTNGIADVNAIQVGTSIEIPEPDQRSSSSGVAVSTSPPPQNPPLPDVPALRPWKWILVGAAAGAAVDYGISTYGLDERRPPVVGAFVGALLGALFA